MTETIESVVHEGMRTPWGSAQTARVLAPGIGLVSTAGHGGIKLTAERNRQVPAYMRRDGGWYEEDCEASIPLVVFEALIRQHGPAWLVQSLDDYPPIKTVIGWYPDAAAKWLKRDILPEESMVLRERIFKAQHASDYVVVSAWGSWQEGVPEGMVGVFATLGESRQEPLWSQGRYFLVSDAEYQSRQGSFVIELDRHQEVADFTKLGTKTKRVVMAL
jgi:hypothetical protein